jgi:hypothetical protein
MGVIGDFTCTNGGGFGPTSMVTFNASVGTSTYTSLHHLFIHMSRALIQIRTLRLRSLLWTYHSFAFESQSWRRCTGPVLDGASIHYNYFILYSSIAGLQIG